MEKLTVSWAKYLESIDSLLSKIKEENFTSLIAIGRGGLIVGTIISHQLNIPMTCIMATSYDNNNQQKDVKLSSFCFTQIVLDNILIVDDISDSGKTIIAVKNKLKKDFGVEAKTATIFLSDNSIIKPDFYVSQVRQNVWLNFPYENFNNKQLHKEKETQPH